MDVLLVEIFLFYKFDLARGIANHENKITNRTTEKN